MKAYVCINNIEKFKTPDGYPFEAKMPFTIGKTYYLYNTEGKVYIIDDNNSSHAFYSKRFISLEDLREEKLNKLLK